MEIQHATQLQKILYGLLIFWVCGVGPLITLESFSAHQGVQRYQPAILGKSVISSSKLPVELVRALNQVIYAEPIFWPHPESVIKNYQPGRLKIALFFYTTFNDNWFLVGKGLSLEELRYFGRVWESKIQGHSAWLPPPEKPPPFC